MMNLILADVQIALQKGDFSAIFLNLKWKSGMADDSLECHFESKLELTR